MSALQALRTSDRTLPCHQGWKVYEIVPPVGCPPPSKKTFFALIPIYNKVCRPPKVARKVSVSCTYPPFFVRWQPLYRGGLGKSFEHPPFSKWTSSLNIHLNIHPLKIAFFHPFFAPLLKPHLKVILMPFSYRSSQGVYKAPVRPKRPCIKQFPRIPTKKPHA